MKRFHFKLAAAFCLLVAAATQAADNRADFLKLIDRPRVPLAPLVETSPATNGLVRSRFTFASDVQQRVPGILLKAADSTGRRPVVIVLHGTGGKKQDNLPLLRKFAGKGFVAVAIDGRYHGERTQAGQGTAEYEAAIIRAWHEQREHPFFYDTVWDVMRLLDYLETRDDVDPKRIGLTGISKGGIETYFTAAVDPRVAVAVPCIGVQSFQWALDNNDWKGRIGTIQKAFDNIAKEEGVPAPDSAFVRRFYDRVVPGIYGEFDGPAMVPLIAPRPLLVINSDSDHNTPLPGVELCAEAARKAYQAAGSEDYFVLRIQEKTGHQVLPQSENASVEWFVKWLNP